MSREPTSKIRDILSEKHKLAKENDLLALLDLREESSLTEIKDAYFRLARMVHPDSLQKYQLQDRKEEAALVFEKVTEAFQILSDPARKKAYFEARKGGQPAQSPEAKGKMMEEQAKIALHQGKMMLNRKGWAAAEEYFHQYSQIRPEDAKGYVLLGWALFQNQHKELNVRLEEARAAFQKAIALDDTNADAHFYLALYHKERGQYDQVEKFINTTLKLNRNHVNAQRELRLLQMRQQQAAPSQPSVVDYLKGLFSKKK